MRCDKVFDTLTASERQEHVSNKAVKLRKEKKMMPNLRHSNVQIETFYANKMPSFCVCMNVKCIQSTCYLLIVSPFLKPSRNTFADPGNINDIIT